jgi:hypothetical protein
MGKKRLAHADGANDGDVVMGLQEAEGGEFVEEGAIKGHLRGRVPVLERGPGIEAGPLGSHGLQVGGDGSGVMGVSFLARRARERAGRGGGAQVAGER